MIESYGRYCIFEEILKFAGRCQRYYFKILRIIEDIVILGFFTVGRGPGDLHCSRIYFGVEALEASTRSYHRGIADVHCRN